MSLMPVRCFTCNAIIWQLTYEKYVSLGKTPAETLNAMNIKRICCRRIYLTHTNIDDQVILFPKIGDGMLELKK